MTETDPLKRLYRSLSANVTQGVAGDVMLMPPSWGELLTAVHEAAFLDDDTTTVTSGIEAVKRIAYGEGWDDGYGEGHAAGYRAAVLRFVDRGDVEPDSDQPEPSKRALESLNAWLRIADDSADEAVLYAASKYAESNPEWFAGWDESDIDAAFIMASNAAYDAQDFVASNVLVAARWVYGKNPDLFGGEA